MAGHAKFYILIDVAKVTQPCFVFIDITPIFCRCFSGRIKVAAAAAAARLLRYGLRDISFASRGYKAVTTARPTAHVAAPRPSGAKVLPRAPVPVIQVHAFIKKAYGCLNQAGATMTRHAIIEALDILPGSAMAVYSLQAGGY